MASARDDLDAYIDERTAREPGFRARHAAWTFTVYVSHDINAAAIDPPEDKPGFFQIDEYRGYYLSGDYGKEHEASFMRYDEAERIILECAQQYLRAAAKAV